MGRSVPESTAIRDVQRPPIPPPQNEWLEGFAEFLAQLMGASSKAREYTAGSQGVYGQSPALNDAFDQDMRTSLARTGPISGARSTLGINPLAATARPSATSATQPTAPSPARPGLVISKPTDLVLDPSTGKMVSRGVLDVKTALATGSGGKPGVIARKPGEAVPASEAAAFAASQGIGTRGAGTAVGGGAPATAKAPVAPAATGWEEEFYRTHGRFPSEWDFADKLWSEDMARRTGRSPTRADWVGHALENRFDPARPATSEFAPGWGLDTSFGPSRPAPMSDVPQEVQLAGPITALGGGRAGPGQRFEKPTGAPRVAASATARAPEKAPGAWGQPIPTSWDTATGDAIYGKWLEEGGSGEVGDWIDHIIAIGAAG